MDQKDRRRNTDETKQKKKKENKNMEGFLGCGKLEI
jgi:hypothetical protein